MLTTVTAPVVLTPFSVTTYHPGVTLYTCALGPDDQLLVYAVYALSGRWSIVRLSVALRRPLAATCRIVPVARSCLTFAADSTAPVRTFPGCLTVSAHLALTWNPSDGRCVASTRLFLVRLLLVLLGQKAPEREPAQSREIRCVHTGHVW